MVDLLREFFPALIPGKDAELLQPTVINTRTSRTIKITICILCDSYNSLHRTRLFFIICNHMIKSTSFQATFFHEISCSNLLVLPFFKKIFPFFWIINAFFTYDLIKWKDLLFLIR